MFRLLSPFLLAGCTGQAAVTEPRHQPDPAALDPATYAPDRVIVGFRGAPERVAWGGRLLAERRAWPRLGAALVEVAAGEDVAAVAEGLRATGRYAYVELDVLRSVSVNDPYYGYQWHMARIGATDAWTLGGDGSGAVVAVIDTGVSAAGQDTPALVAGWDFVGDDGDPDDEHGHGTHVAGTVAQATDNGKGVVGVAPGAVVMPVRVLDADGYGSSADVIDGILWAADNGADVINMSLGSYVGSSAEEAAVDYAVAAGVTVVAAAGNGGYRNRIAYPAAYAGSIAVGATRYDDARSYYSNRGDELDLAAPGGDTRVDQNGDGYGDGVLQETFHDGVWAYWFFQGTSMASPHVAGTAALLAGLGADRASIRSLLEGTATDLGRDGWDSSYGWGLVDADAAVAAWLGADTGGGGGGGTGGDTTPPVIADVVVTDEKSMARLDFTTDEPATGLVCNTKGDCATTPFGTAHTATIAKRGGEATIEATDEAGNTSVYGPFAL